MVFSRNQSCWYVVCVLFVLLLTACLQRGAAAYKMSAVLPIADDYPDFRHQLWVHRRHRVDGDVAAGAGDVVLLPSYHGDGEAEADDAGDNCCCDDHRSPVLCRILCPTSTGRLYAQELGQIQGHSLGDLDYNDIEEEEEQQQQQSTDSHDSDWQLIRQSAHSPAVAAPHILMPTRSHHRPLALAAAAAANVDEDEDVLGEDEERRSSSSRSRNSGPLFVTRRQENRLLSCQESSCSGQRGEVLRHCTWAKCRRHLPGFKRHQRQSIELVPPASPAEHLDEEKAHQQQQQPLQRSTRAWIDYTSDCQRLACSAVRRGNHVIRLCEQLACDDYF